jgi:hypothetical protein
MPPEKADAPRVKIDAADLVRRLSLATLSGAIDWRPVPDDEDSFRAGLDTASVAISRLTEFTASTPRRGNVLLELLNENGRSVWRYRAENQDINVELTALLELARRKALNTDEVLASILDQIATRSGGASPKAGE